MIKFENGKYVGYVNGRAIVKTSSKYYCERKVAEMVEATVTAPAPVVSEYDINERFGFVEQMVTMIADGTMPSAIITGEGGLGKSFTVYKALEKAGLINITDLAGFEDGAKLLKSKAYRVVKGYSTAKGLYRTLFDCNGMTIVFDDCDQVLKDEVAKNLLKGALDSFSKRYISWMADMRDEDLPKTFEFTGRVIFISNKQLESIDQAIRTRCMVVDLSMNSEQKLQRMEVIAKSDEFLPEVQPKAKEDALVFLKKNIDRVPNLSLRSLIQVAKIANRGGDWQGFAKYVLSQGS